MLCRKIAYFIACLISDSQCLYLLCSTIIERSLHQNYVVCDYVFMYLGSSEIFLICLHCKETRLSSKYHFDKGIFAVGI